MNWKFWKKQEEESKLHQSVVSMPTLIRWHLYDAPVGEPNALAVKLGLTPLSEEVEEAEIEASMRRVSAVEPYHAFLAAMSTVTAEILSVGHSTSISNMKPDAKKEDVDLIGKFLEEMYEDIAFVALHTAFSAGLSLGIIHTPEHLDIKEGEVDDQ
jgi:hypothetical protein